jgi:plasmid stabilization system protein ParE
MYNIEITDSALQDLADIQEYLAVSLGNPSAASDFFEQVYITQNGTVSIASALKSKLE